MKGIRSMLIAAVLFAACVGAHAQETLVGAPDTLAIREPKFRYYNQFLTGALIGDGSDGPSVSAQTVHGVRYKRASLGIGVSYDAYYNLRTIPLFGTIALEFARIKDNALFYQISAGYAKSWHAQPPADWWGYNYDHRGGRMVQHAIGYQVKADKWRLYFTTGFRMQRIRYKEVFNIPPWSSEWWPYSQSSYKMDMNRIYLSLGFGIN